MSPSTAVIWQIRSVLFTDVSRSWVSIRDNDTHTAFPYWALLGVEPTMGRESPDVPHRNARWQRRIIATAWHSRENLFESSVD
jgi:hypothetical protein